MTYEIVTQGTVEYIDQIQALGDKHRSTLGFLPAGSFQEYANDNNLYCAVSEGKVIAYILFRYRKRSNSILLVHVCVSDEMNKHGIATDLINTIAYQNSHAYYIEARCRRDYKLDNFWKNAGFHVINECSGRSLEGSTLTVWRRMIIKEDLVDLIIKQSSKDRVIAVLDTNIVIALCDDPHSSVRCLLDDKIHEGVIYCITPELAIEINKKDDDQIRAKHLKYISQFHQIKASDIDLGIFHAISRHIDTNGTHTADIRHIVYCIQEKSVDVFITNDEWIHAHRCFFAEQYSLLVFYPEEFWRYVFSDVDQDIISARIIGTKYKYSPLNNNNMPGAVALHQAIGVKKRTWNAELRKEMIDKSISTWVMLEEDRVIGLISIKHHSHYDSIIHLFVSVQENRRIFRFLVKALVEKAILSISESILPKQCIALLLPYPVSDNIIPIMLECGFLKLASGAIRLISKGARKREELIQTIDGYISLLATETSASIQLGSVSSFFRNCHDNQLEFFLSPAVVFDLNLPTYIISINPNYAINLFDEKLANTNISFLENPYIYAALSSTNAYYTKSAVRFPTPCRILWYVKRDKRYAYSGAIRACSIMLTHHYDQTKELFTRYGQFGVLNWENLKANDRIGLFTFCNTVLFNKAISHKELVAIASTWQTKQIQLQGPYHISEVLAQELLLRGLE